MSLRIDQIRTDGGTQSRAAINADTVADYAEAMADSDTVFPPVVVYHDGREYWLADGFHRLEAWRQIGRVEVPTEIRQGDRRRAVLHSCGANAAHGLRRSNADKRRAVMVMLEDDEWSAWSDRQIARQCGVSQPFVSKLRKGEGDNGYHPEPEDRAPEATGSDDSQGKANAEAAPVHKPAAPPAAADKAGKSVADQAADGPADHDEPHDPVHAQKLDAPAEADPHRAGLSGLTRTGLEDEVTGLRAENAELRTKLAKAEAERDRFKAANKELTSGDQGATISRLQKQVQASKLARDDAMSAAKRMEYRLKKALAKVEEITGQEIDL